MQGDVLIAINGFTVSHLDLTELMEMIKLSGWTLHLTLIRLTKPLKFYDIFFKQSFQFRVQIADKNSSM